TQVENGLQGTGLIVDGFGEQAMWKKKRRWTAWHPPRLPPSGPVHLTTVSRFAQTAAAMDMDTVWSFAQRCLDQTSYQWLYTLLAVLSPWFAIKLISFYVASQRGRPVDFEVPSPPELSPEWKGKTWNEIEGKVKDVLEG